MRRVKLVACLAVILALGLLLHEAAGTPGHSDDTAAGVLSLWVLRAFIAPRRGRGVAAAAGSGPRFLRPAFSTLGWVVSGLLVYSFALRLPDATPAGGGGLPGPVGGGPRPAVVVTSAANPVFVGRVVAVGRDLTLMVDAGVPGAAIGVAGPGDTVAGGPDDGPPDVISLSGVNAFECDRHAVETAARALKARVLGRLVVVEVTGLEAGGDGVPGPGADKSWPPRVRAIVYGEESIDRKSVV